ncbi:3805_t:CDS:2 [Ambispora gerdemannii]|uniref:3805_t:CDS:1 n=1 Tax=Ambispora gerdemannii TaxID=144530 RepID=A0A9N9FYN7_9GLOM|nr:3805_t:CDS:2 [Ambispora gerdemannii]
MDVHSVIHSLRRTGPLRATRERRDVACYVVVAEIEPALVVMVLAVAITIMIELIVVLTMSTSTQMLLLFCLKYSEMRWRAMVFDGRSFLLFFHCVGPLRVVHKRRGAACYGSGGGN